MPKQITLVSYIFWLTNIRLIAIIERDAQRDAQADYFSGFHFCHWTEERLTMIAEREPQRDAQADYISKSYVCFDRLRQRLIAIVERDPEFNAVIEKLA